MALLVKVNGMHMFAFRRGAVYR